MLPVFCGVFPIPAGYAISSHCFCWRMRLSKGKEEAAKSEKMPNDKIKYKIVKLNKNCENIFAPLMQLRCCCQEANLQCHPPPYPSWSLLTSPWAYCPQAALPGWTEASSCYAFALQAPKKMCVINGRVPGGNKESGRAGGGWGGDREEERELRIELRSGIPGNYINAYIREMTRSRFGTELWALGI